MEIVREEVKEECGYLAPLEAFTKIVTFPESVGFSGFYNAEQNIPFTHSDSQEGPRLCSVWR